MLTVGKDSYVTLEEANDIISENFISTDEVYVFWQGLSDSDKEALLRSSRRSIDSLKFTGRRKVPGQILEFPRVNMMPSGYGFRLYIGQFYDNGLYSPGGCGDGLIAVSIAQVINAVYAGYYNNAMNTSVEQGILGLTSKKAGPIAETYGKNGNSGLDSADAQIGIYTKQVYQLLNSWLSSSRVSY